MTSLRWILKESWRIGGDIRVIEDDRWRGMFLDDRRGVELEFLEVGR